MARLFDPLLYLESKGAVVRFEGGEIRLTFETWVKLPERRRLERWAKAYDRLLKLQLDVTADARPRTIQQLIAAGKVSIKEGRYRGEVL